MVALRISAVRRSLRQGLGGSDPPNEHHPKIDLAAKPAQLASALKDGGMVPDLRALRLQEIAMRVQDQHGGDLSDALRGSLKEARKLLKQFPSISDPGADRILLFAAIAAIAVLPSNNVSLIVRLRYDANGKTIK